MTSTLGRKAPDGVEMLITALSALDGIADWCEPTGTVVPRFMVTDIPGGVSDKVTDAGIYSVHTFHTDYWECRKYAFQADDLILSLGPPLAVQERIILADGRIAYADEVIQSVRPHYEKWTDNLIRYVARYSMKLRLR